MEVKVVLEAILKQYERSSVSTIQVRENARLMDILKELGIPEEEVMIAFIDHKEANLESPLHQGATVTLCPFICGG